jgi:hypothetical protein
MSSRVKQEPTNRSVYGQFGPLAKGHGLGPRAGPLPMAQSRAAAYGPGRGLSMVASSGNIVLPYCLLPAFSAFGPGGGQLAGQSVRSIGCRPPARPAWSAGATAPGRGVGPEGVRCRAGWERENKEAAVKEETQEREESARCPRRRGLP